MLLKLLRLSLASLVLLFCLSSLAFAQQAAGGAPAAVPGPGEMFSKMLPMFIILMVFFYMVVLRPQEKERKERESMLDGLKKNEMVVTSGGIIAKVAAVEKDHILLEISAQAKMKVQKAHILRRYEQPQKNEKQAAGSKAAAKKA